MIDVSALGPGKWCDIGTGDEIKNSAHMVEGAAKEAVGKIVHKEELAEEGHEEKEEAKDKQAKENARQEGKHKGNRAAMPDFKESTTLPVNDEND